MPIVKVYAATFGWLCVETCAVLRHYTALQAATFGWLCVETYICTKFEQIEMQPPSGGCVLKQSDS